MSASVSKKRVWPEPPDRIQLRFQNHTFFAVPRLLVNKGLTYDRRMGIVAIETRRAGPQDAAQIAEVHDSAWLNAYSGVLPHKALARMVQRRGTDWWANAIRRSTVVLVIEMAGKIAGYATIGRNRVSTLPYAGEVYELYLKPEYQGIGLGTRLFLAARGELGRRKLKGTVVWVLADNEQAISFYENAGGRAIAEGSERFDGKKVPKLAFAWD